MRPRTTLNLIFGLALAATTAVVFAEDAFHIHYRFANLNEDEYSLSGNLILNVYNTSGEDAQDLVAMIPGPNGVTYDNRPIFLGTLADGEQVEILDRFVVPEELIRPNSPEDAVSWQLEFTNALGARITLDVVGQKVE